MSDVKVLNGDRLRNARERLGMTQEELAAELGFGHSQLNKYENNKRDPTLESLVKLARRLNVSVDWLVGLVDEPQQRLTEADLSADQQRYITLLRSGDLKKLIEMALNDMQR